jgi:hypothetical protein
VGMRASVPYLMHSRSSPVPPQHIAVMAAGKTTYMRTSIVPDAEDTYSSASVEFMPAKVLQDSLHQNAG